MKNQTKNNITSFLFQVQKKAEELASIEEKREFYKKILKLNLPFISIDEEVDVDSEDVDYILTDQFLNVKTEDAICFQNDGFHPWLDDCIDKIDWNFYKRYEQYLINDKHWSPVNINSLMTVSDNILDHIANPKSKDFFEKKGLVLGDIQSGKTANYTAVINKALDAGYKIVIVLAGMTRDLRNQTQKRLDAEILGYETRKTGKGNAIGVGKYKNLSIEGLTYADEEKDFGDFKKFFSQHSLDENLTPLVAIVKKNSSVLTHLLDFLTTSQEYCYTSDKKLKIPVLIIDDEVDQASVDTKDGNKIEEASTINKLIRTILNGLARYSYIGYTATPFANVLIDPNKENDIYPKDFILYIPTPKDYSGINEYFGIDIKDNDDKTSDSERDLFVEVNDIVDLFSDKKITKDTTVIALNKSLRQAIQDFILSCSIKKARGIDEHCSMLIHVARVKNPSTTMKPLIASYIDSLISRLMFNTEDELNNYHEAWLERFFTTSKKRLGENYHDEWLNIEKYIETTLRSINNNICVLNGDSDDQIDYSSTNTGCHIVIGGDKLSRGLTLDGLSISYYYRNSKAYDSILQMGRWFGYRKGWIDLCRVYTSKKCMKDFITIGKVIQRFKQDLDEMSKMHLNPREVGQRIMYSPNLIPTARNKMKSTTKLKVSFSGELQQIISFDKNNIESNFSLTNKFIENLKKYKHETRENNKVVFKNVSYNDVLDYLKNYKEYGAYQYGQISIKNWRNYIENLVKKGELTDWTIVINSLRNRNQAESVEIGGFKIYKPTRTLREPLDDREYIYKVKTNTDPTDFKEFYDEGSEYYKSIDHYDATKKYPGFDATKAIMSIYIVDLYDKVETGYDHEKNKRTYKRGDKLESGTNVCSPAIWFPKTNDYNNSAITYYVNNDYIAIKEEQDAYMEEEK